LKSCHSSKEAVVPVLLLAQGDAEAKDLLRKAIEARYGLRPPAIESLQMVLKGRARAQVGPITTWVPIDATAHVLFPVSIRWEYTARAVGVPVHRGVEAFDGVTYRRSSGGSPPEIIADGEQISSMQSRLWAIAAVFLTPLGEHFVKLTATGHNSLDATNTQSSSAVSLRLRPDNTLDQVEAASCLNPDTGKRQTFFLRLSTEQSLVNDLMLPCKISTAWDDTPYFEVEPSHVETNPQLPGEMFTLGEAKM
jgi:hypothetical protein